MHGDLLVGATGVVIPRAELAVRFSRSSGPGGQGVNTTDSRVELTWDVASSSALTDVQRARLVERLGSRLVGGTLTVVAAEHREQLRNRAAATERLAALVAQAIAPPPRRRRASRPTRGSIERRLATKAHRSTTKRLRSGRVDE